MRLQPPPEGVHLRLGTYRWKSGPRRSCLACFSRTALLKRVDEVISRTRMVSEEISQGPVDLFLSRALALETGNGDLEFRCPFPCGHGSRQH
jgi:hypothetical protein